MKKIFLILTTLILCSTLSFSTDYFVKGKKIKIWEGVDIKGSSISYIVPYYTRFLGDKRPCVIICPGGSYHHLGMNHEGHKVAKWFANQGITAIVLRYRVSGDGFSHPAMLEDIQRTIQIIRDRASIWRINPEKIGVIGFSAGGHLAVMTGAFGDTNELEKLGIKTSDSLKPNFVMSIYPVVSMEYDIGHKWSRKSLIGKNPSKEMIDKFSMEKQITPKMCPVFILTNKDDKTVNYQNSVRLDQALTEANVPHVFILNETGDHGFGMGNNKFCKQTKWNENWLLPWIEQNGFLY